MELLVEKHSKYIHNLTHSDESLEYCKSEHLRLNAVYWSLTALDLMGKRDILDKKDTLEFIASCQHENGMSVS